MAFNASSLPDQIASLHLLHDCDESTASLIIRLQLEDVETLKQRSHSAPVGSGHHLALQWYGGSLHQYRYQRRADGEERAVNEALVASFIEASINTSEAGDTNAGVNPDNEAADANAAPPATVVTFKCRACEDQFASDHCFQAPCQHHYCDGDLETLLRLSLTDLSLYPPRCCNQTIPFEDVKIYLSPELVRDFAAKKEELDDPHPLYCHVAACSQYIGASNKNSFKGACVACNEYTCVSCRQKYHNGDCKEDEAIRTTLALADDQGWRRCPGCERMVELRSGCNHMTYYTTVLQFTTCLLTRVQVPIAASSSVTSARPCGRVAIARSSAVIASISVLLRSRGARVVMMWTL